MQKNQPSLPVSRALALQIHADAGVGRASCREPALILVSSEVLLDSLAPAVQGRSVDRVGAAARCEPEGLTVELRGLLHRLTPGQDFRRVEQALLQAWSAAFGAQVFWLGLASLLFRAGRFAWMRKVMNKNPKKYDALIEANPEVEKTLAEHTGVPHGGSYPGLR